VFTIHYSQQLAYNLTRWAW